MSRLGGLEPLGGPSSSSGAPSSLAKPLDPLNKPVLGSVRSGLPDPTSRIGAAALPDPVPRPRPPAAGSGDSQPANPPTLARGGNNAPQPALQDRAPFGSSNGAAGDPPTLARGGGNNVNVAPAAPQGGFGLASELAQAPSGPPPAPSYGLLSEIQAAGPPTMGPGVQQPYQPNPALMQPGPLPAPGAGNMPGMNGPPMMQPPMPMTPTPYPHPPLAALQIPQPGQTTGILRAPPPLFTIEQLPPDQRIVTLTPPQANDLMHQLSIQALQVGGRPPVLVDLVDSQALFMGNITAPPHSYLDTVETAAPNKRLPVNVKPSLLQTKLKTGHNRLQDLVQPMLDPGQQRFVDLAFSPDGQLLEELGRSWQCKLALVRVEGVPPTGLQHERNVCLRVARIALFDRQHNRFLGNVLGLRPTAVNKKESLWTFNEQLWAIIRCSCVQPDAATGTRLVNDDALSIYIELNVSYRLDVADTKNMPPSEAKAAKLVDEFTTAWSMINFKRCLSTKADMEVSVPLYYGSLYDPKMLDSLYKAKRQANPMSSLFQPKPNPVLVFKAGLPQTNPPPLLPYSFMPSTIVATDELGTALAAYRATLALQLARQPSVFTPVSDPVLSAFPGILGDHHLLTEFLVKWKDASMKLAMLLEPGCLGPSVMPPIAALMEAFRRCVVEVSPLLHCPSLPPRHINNFVEYQGHRLKMVQTFCHIIDPRTNTVVAARHPVEPLSHAGFEFLHAPFNVAEVRLCVGDTLERDQTFLRPGR